MGGSNPDAAGSYSFLNTHKPPPDQRIITTESLTYSRSLNRQHGEYPEIDDAVVRRGDMKIAASIHTTRNRVHPFNPRALIEQWDRFRTPPPKRNHQANKRADY